MNDSVQHCPYCVKVAGHRRAPGYGCAGLRVGVGVPITVVPPVVLPGPGEEPAAARRVLMEIMLDPDADKRTRAQCAIAVQGGKLELHTTEELAAELERRLAAERKPR